MESSNEEDSGGQPSAGFNDLIVDTQALHVNKEDTNNMNNFTHLIEASEGAMTLPDNAVDTSSAAMPSLEVTQGAPMLLGTTADHAVTMAFLQRPDIFAGRAISASAVLAESSDADNMDDVQRLAENVTTSRPASSGTGQSHTPSPPVPSHFTPNRSVSLLSRALRPDDLYTESKATGALEPSTAQIEYNTSDSDQEAGVQIGSDAGEKGVNMVSGMEERWRSRFPLIRSVDPLDTGNTSLEIEGEHYQIPNSDIWLCSWNTEQVMLADELAEMIRPDFYASIGLLGAEKAIKAVNGHKLPVSNAASSPSYDTMTADSDAAGYVIEEEELNNISLVARKSSRPWRKVSDEAIAHEIGSNSSTAASDNSAAYNYVQEGSEMDGTLEKTPRPLLSPIHRLRSGSLNSVNTIGTPHSETEDELDEDELCRFVDTVRAALSSQNIADEDFEQLTKIIDLFLEPEYCEEGADKDGQLGLIARIRFDKLLEDLAHLRTDNAEYRGLVVKASSLQRLWKERFRGDYLLIERERLETMLTYGALHGLNMVDIDAETKLPLWTVKRGPPIIGPDLKPGRFWLNIECAYRDGIVESNLEQPSPGKYDGTPTLPLLTGTEVDEAPGCTRYKKECRAKDMPYNFMTKGEHFQGKVRLLRGHELKSKYAPKAGVRYDGEYLLKGWAHLPTPDLDVDMRQFELVLERIPGQPSYLIMPSPAQLDDWHLYQKYVTAQKTRAMKAYSTLLTDEREEADPLTDVANTEWEFDQMFMGVSDDA